MEIPKDLQYTDEHEWIRVEDDVVTVGITDYAQGELGDIVFIELPEINSDVLQMQPFGTIEAVKAVSDLYAPVSGKIVDVNILLEKKPELINHDPYGDGWMIKIKYTDKSEMKSLLSAEDYSKMIS